jgi:FimV-like protein
MSFMRIFASITVLLLTSPVGALGLGDLSTDTSLGENFAARIEIVGDDIADLDDLRVGLASIEDFQQAGIAFHSSLSELSFHTHQDGAGSYVEVTSARPILEPYLNLLVELQWGGIQLFREYALLIDPPNRRDDRIEIANNDERGDIDVSGRMENTRELFSGGTNYAYGPVRTTDTLWSISEKLVPSGATTVNQMMLALLGANPNSFGYGNVNFLRKGAYLRMPSESELRRYDSSQAREIVLRHHATWKGIVSKRTSEISHTLETVSMVQPDRLEVVVPVDTDLAEEELEDNTAAQSQLMREEIDIRSQQNDELLGKLEEAEGIISLLQKQVRMQDEQLMLLQARLSKLERAPSASSGSETTSEQSNRRRPASLQNEVDERPVINFVPGSRELLVILVLLCVSLITVFFVVKRNQRKQQKLEDDQGDAELVPVKDNDSNSENHKQEMTTLERSDSATNSRPEDDKPLLQESFESSLLEEINIHLAYEEFDKAESLVQAAIDANPDVHHYKLLLLRVHSAAENQAAFRESVRDIFVTVGTDDPIREEANAIWETVFPEQSLASYLEEQLQADDVNSFSENEAPIKRQPDDLSSQVANEEEKQVVDFDGSDLGNNLNLARAYIELGDNEAARKLLEQTIKDGNEQQRDEARALLENL